MRPDSPLLEKLTVFQKLSKLCCYYSVSFVTKKMHDKLLENYGNRYVAVNKVLLHSFYAAAISKLPLRISKRSFKN